MEAVFGGLKAAASTVFDFLFQRIREVVLVPHSSQQKA
jgi:hypothetical protein